MNPESLEDWLRRVRGGTSREERRRSLDVVRRLQDSLEDDPLMAAHAPRVMLQGSASTGTAIPGESDLDLCVMFEAYRRSRPEGSLDLLSDRSTMELQRIILLLRGHLERHLHARYTPSVVSGLARCLRIESGRAGPVIDVVPAVRFVVDERPTLVIAESIGLDGRPFFMMPHETRKGIGAKDGATRGRFREVVRIYKAIKQDCLFGQSATLDPSNGDLSDLPSCLIESVLWNVPNEHFMHATYHRCVGCCCKWLLESMWNATSALTWTEPNGVIPIGWEGQRWDAGLPLTSLLWRTAKLCGLGGAGSVDDGLGFDWPRPES